MHLAYVILAMIDVNSLKHQDISSKLVSFYSIRLTLQVDQKDMYLWLKSNLLFSKKLWFSCLYSMEQDILDMIGNKSLKTQDIPLKLVSFDSICLTLQENHKNMYLSLKNNLLSSNKCRFSCLPHTEYDILAMIDDNSF